MLGNVGNGGADGSSGSSTNVGGVGVGRGDELGDAAGDAMELPAFGCLRRTSGDRLEVTVRWREPAAAPAPCSVLVVLGVVMVGGREVVAVTLWPSV